MVELTLPELKQILGVCKNSVGKRCTEQIQEQIEVSTASEIVCLSLLEKFFQHLLKKFEEKGNSKDLNPILKKRFLENMSERQWREFFFKDQFYTISIQEDLWSLQESKDFFIRWLGEMQEAKPSSLSLSTGVTKNALEIDEWPNNQLGLSTNLSSEEDEDSQEIPLQNPIGKRARIGGLLAPLSPTSRHKKSEAY